MTPDESRAYFSISQFLPEHGFRERGAGHIPCTYEKYPVFSLIDKDLNMILVLPPAAGLAECAIFYFHG